jgi:phage terminase small subunit
MGGPGSGRRRAPDNVRALRGDRPYRRDNFEPVAPVGLPEPPPGLSDEVKAVWDYTLDQMVAMHTASPAIRDLLKAYCEQVVIEREASRLLAMPDVRVIRAGAVKSTIVKNVLVQIQRDAALAIRVLGSALGLYPDTHTARRDEDDGTGPERLLT